MADEGLPPQRRQASASRNVAPQQAAQDAERRLGKPCYHVGQRVQGLFACITCQFRIRNRAVLPACPDCGELIWAYMETGPRPVPEGEPELPAGEAAPTARVEEGVKLAPTTAPVTVQENVKLDLP
ncbi:MAG: hypothetical protein QOK40_178 [Miltoncostaeaceae bacterium]|nr:hypothetical protein [Miltoncostaeaceae bacterium]